MANIELEEISLTYPVYGTDARSLKASVMQFATGGKLNRDSSTVKVEALKNITLKLEDGDRLGLIGHNGSGKTTLLKVLAQIYEPTSGKLKISGQTNCIFDITMGMDQELTGYENILLRGIILGLSKQKIKSFIPEIEEFAELGDFMKMPIKSYSAGMLVRLAFGIITSISSEILLVDEIVNVGDARFIAKAKNRITNLVERAKIMVLSTHDHNLLRELCNKVLVLNQGKIEFFGPAQEFFVEKTNHQSHLKLEPVLL